MSRYLDSHNVKQGKGGRFTRARRAAKRAAVAGAAGVAATTALGRKAGGKDFNLSDSFSLGTKLISSHALNSAGRVLDKLSRRKR